jgi:hypothetical protein
MPDISLRKFTEEEYAAIKAHAAASDLSMEGWAKALILQAIQSPVVKARYVLKAYGPGPAQAQIRRVEDTIGGGASNLSEEQMQAYRQAKEFAKRNEPGDREAAHHLLAMNFETVFETVM